jgi:spore germination protein D
MEGSKVIRTIKAAAPWLLIFGILTGCGSDSQQSNISYKEIKSMVVDILKTEEGQKAIREATAKKKEGESDQMRIMQMLESPQGEQIKMAVKEVITDPSYPKILQDMMTDPKFAGEFAKAVQKENKQIHKELMKDPEYQTLLLETLKNPEFEKMFMDLMKSKAYRQQMMTVMTDALENPIFKLKLLELMEKALEEQSKPKSEKGKNKDGEDGGGEGGGGGQGGGSGTS